MYVVRAMSSTTAADQKPSRPPQASPTTRSQLESLPSSVVTLTLLPFVESSELLLFRTACQTAYAFVHGRRLALPPSNANADNKPAASCDVDNNNSDSNNPDEPTASEEEANILWREVLSKDFGFMSEEEEKALGQLHESEVDYAQRSETNHEVIETRRKYRRMFLRTMRLRPSRTADNGVDSNRSFLETDEVFTASTPFESWKHWKKLWNQFQMCALRADGTTGSNTGLYAPYYLRSATLWQKIENWCDRRGSFGASVKTSFVPGRAVNAASLLDDDDEESDPMSFICSALQAIWSFCGGQKMPQTKDECLAGLFGGYCAYDLFSCSRLIDVSEIINRRRQMGSRGFGIAMPIAHNSAPSRSNKMFLIVRHLGRAFVAPDADVPRLMPCDAIEWLDMYASKLEQGIYECGDLLPPQSGPSRAILLYPTVADTVRTSRAVTRGIEVVASGVDAVEQPGMFIYSIRIRLLSPGEDGYVSASERGFKTCQLRSRHWIISQGDDEDEPEHVRGDGVVGMYPLLRESGYDLYEGQTAATAEIVETETQCDGKFAYQSCTQASNGGTLGGYLQFVPGSLVSPTGEEFDVRVAPFPLGEEDILF